MIDREKIIQHFEGALKAYGKDSKLRMWRFVQADILEDAITLLNEQSNIIEKYHKADSFLFAHGWRWTDD